MTAPRIAVQFTGETDQVAAAIRALTGELRGLTTETRRQGAGAQQAQQQTATFAERLRVGRAEADPFARGLKNLYDQTLQVAQGTASAARGVHSMTAAMSRAAAQSTDVLRFNQSLALASQQRAAQDAAAAAAATAAAARTGLLTRASTGLLTTVKGLAGGYGALRLVGFINDAIKAAAAVNDLAQKTGATAETLSILEFVGRRNEVSAEALGTSFRRLAITVGQLRDGNREAEESFAEIGLTAQDLEGLTVDQKFLKIAAAIAKVPDGLEKSEIATKLFGRAGAELIPLLNELAERGFPALADEAAAAGAVITTEAAKAADEYRDALDNLKASAAGLARTFTADLLPKLTDLARNTQREVQALVELVQGVQQAARNIQSLRLGPPPRAEPVPFDPNIFRLGLPPPEAPAGPTPAPAPRRATDREITALAALRRAGVASREELERIDQVLVQLRDDFAKTTDVARRAELQSKIASLTKTTTERGGTGDRAAVAQDALERARLEARAAARERERALLRTLAEGEAADNERALAQGEQSLARFFARRLELIRTAMENEVALLEREREAIATAPVLSVEERIRRNPRLGRGEAEHTREQEVEERAARVAAVEARIDLAREQGDQQRLAALDQQRVAERQLAEERLGFEQRIRQARGETFELTVVAIEEESRKFAEVLTRQQVGVKDRTQRVEEFRQVLTTRTQVDEVSTRAQQTFSEIARERERITQEVQVGVLTERQGQEQLAALERARLPVLQELAQQMQVFAEQLDNDELRQAAAQLTAQVDQLAVSADLAAQRAARFRSQIADAAEGSIRNVLGSGLDQLGQPNPNSGAIAVREREAEELRRRIDELNEAAARGNQDAAAQIRALEAEYEGLQGRIAELRSESVDLFDVLRQGFTDLLEGIRQVLNELIAADLVEGLRGAFGGRREGGVLPPAPAGLETQDVGQLASLAPDLSQGAQQAASAAQATAAATALAAAGASVTAGGAAVSAGAAALGASGGVVVTGAAGLSGSAAALSASGSILITAAAALQAAAAALAAANAAGGVAGGLAGGGYLDGPGSPTSDSFLIRASRTEFMQPARAVRFYGRDFMEDVRHLRLPKFATGGLIGRGDGVTLPALPSFTLPTLRLPALPRVPSVPDGAAGAPRAELAGELRVLLERGLILDTVRSYMGSRDAETDHIRLSAATRSRRQAGGT